MEEKILTQKKNGLAVLVGLLVGDLVLVFAFISAIASLPEGFPLAIGVITCIFLFIASLVCYAGIKIIKPQEALVLTLFGNYIGTIREAGIYFVNPFCVAVNPANNTRLGQSGDVTTKSPMSVSKTAEGNNISIETGKKNISLKVMTLNNSRQKINDCLGNPVEIGIAVTWRVVDTAKAVFNVDNYKE